MLEVEGTAGEGWMRALFRGNCCASGMWRHLCGCALEPEAVAWLVRRSLTGWFRVLIGEPGVERPSSREALMNRMAMQQGVRP